ncbi:MAG: hypothetical protein MK135_15065, partial [Polyangiaceae bacterium]|nr:hypothetical protein [Polyangiaceae bacterium]
GATTYARYMYGPEDIRMGQRFLDIMTQRDDGRLVIDYNLFHNTVPMDEEHVLEMHQGLQPGEPPKS